MICYDMSRFFMMRQQIRWHNSSCIHVLIYVHMTIVFRFLRILLHTCSYVHKHNYILSAWAYECNKLYIMFADTHTGIYPLYFNTCWYPLVYAVFIMMCNTLPYTYMHTHTYTDIHTYIRAYVHTYKYRPR